MAFDAMRLGAKRVLFVAHREEILAQAMKSFGSVNPKAKCSVFNADNKEKDADMVFASVQTIGKDVYLTDEFFPKNHFDYIVIDEFHHATAGRAGGGVLSGLTF